MSAGVGGSSTRPLGPHWSRRSAVPAPSAARLTPREPIRAELFSVERLEQHAESLAAAQRHDEPAPRPPALPRLEDNGARPARLLPDDRAGDSRRSARSRRRRNGSSTTSTSSTSSSARSAKTCPRATIASCRSSPRARSRLSARLRRRLGVRRAHRQPVRAREPASLRARLPARAAADHRRAVGGRHHAAHRAASRTCAALAERIVRGRAARQQADALADGLLGLGEPRRRSRRHARALSAGAAADRLRGAARPAVARSGSGVDAGAALARRAPRGSGHHRRGDRAARAPAAGAR